MKKYLCILLMIVVCSLPVMSGCSANVKTSPSTASSPTIQPTATPTVAPQTGDVWAELGWEKALHGDLIEGPWKDLPKLSVEYTYRATSADVSRKLDGNFYAEGWPIVKDQMTLKVLIPQSPYIQDMNTQFVFTNLQKKTNVKISWIIGPNDGASFKDQRNAIIASGDLPDIILGGGTGKNEDLTLGASQGIFIALNDLIDKYGHYAKPALDNRPEVRQDITAPDGKVYSLPFMYTAYYDLYDNKGWINQKWLDKLGLKLPTTTDEFYNVLVAFKTKDPNGNGKADELPLTGTRVGSGWYDEVTGFFMNPFILNSCYGVSPNNFMVVEDGVVSCSAVRPEYKEGLKWFKKLYEAGLLDKDAFVRDNIQFQALGSGQDDVIGTFAGGYFGMATGDINTNRSKQYVALPPLKGPSGSAVDEYTNPAQDSYGEAEITNACKMPEVAFRWLDWFYSPEAQMAMKYGKLGEQWDYAKDGQDGIYGGQAVFSKINELPYDKPNNIIALNLNVPYYEPQMNWANVGNGWYDKAMTDWTKQYYDGHQMKENFPSNPFYSLDVATDMSQKNNDLSTYINEMAAKFITGAADIDKDWDGYLAELDKIGLKSYMQIQQATYDATAKSK